MDALADPPFTLPVCTLLPAEPVKEFDELAELTRRVVGAPSATVTLVDTEQQLFPGAAGLSPRMTAERSTPLVYSFCQYVVLWAEPLIVTDAREHPMLHDNPAITENHVVGYAGMPLHNLAGDVIGSLCVLDSEPHAWTDDQIETLRQLAAVCSAQLQLVESTERAAVLEERDRVAVDLQASVARELLRVSMTLASARSQCDRSVAGLVDTAIDGVDRALSNLRSTVYGRRTER